jgi:tape measure domain-containing protein
MTVGELVGYMDIDDRQWNKKIDQGESRFRRMGTSVMGVASKIAAGLGVTLGVAATVKGLWEAASAGIAYNSSIQQTTISLTTMLGSQEKANALIEEMTEFAAKTPFEFPELADAGTKLLAFGVEAKDIIPTMTTLGDLAAALNIPIGELGELYGKAKVQGRLYMEDINQLTGRGIPVIQEFAKQFGVSESEVRKLVEAGKIGFPQLEKALSDLTGEGGKFHGLMEAQSKSLAGQWSTFKDTLTQILGKLTGPVFTWLSESVLPKLNAALGGVSDALSGTGGVLDTFSGKGAALGGVIEAVMGIMGFTKDLFITAWPAIKAIVGPIIDWISGPSGMGAIENVLKVIQIAQQMAQEIFEAAWPAISTAIKIAEPIIKAVLWAIEKAIQGVLWVMERLQDAWWTISGQGEKISQRNFAKELEAAFIASGAPAHIVTLAMSKTEGLGGVRSIYESGDAWFGKDQAGRQVYLGKQYGGLVTQRGLYPLAEDDKPELVFPMTKPRRMQQLANQYLGMDSGAIVAAIQSLERRLDAYEAMRRSDLRDFKLGLIPVG